MRFLIALVLYAASQNGTREARSIFKLMTKLLNRIFIVLENLVEDA